MLAKTLYRQSVNSLRNNLCTRQQSVARIMTASRSSMMMVNSFRGFSSTASVEKSIQKLNKALEKEIKYENENYSQLDDIETYLNESGFKFSEEENGITMTLTKSLGDKVVEVQFEARYVSFLSIFSQFLFDLVWWIFIIIT